MPAPALDDARRAYDAGNLPSAVNLIWKAIRPATVSQNVVVLEEAQSLALQIADRSEGRVQQDAQQLADYCAGCLIAPQEAGGSVWAFSRWFRRRSGSSPAMKNCPDCAEPIRAEARLCRFCGYRYPDPGE